MHLLKKNRVSSLANQRTALMIEHCSRCKLCRHYTKEIWKWCCHSENASNVFHPHCQRHLKTQESLVNLDMCLSEENSGREITLMRFTLKRLYHFTASCNHLSASYSTDFKQDLNFTFCFPSPFQGLNSVAIS